MTESLSALAGNDRSESSLDVSANCGASDVLRMLISSKNLKYLLLRDHSLNIFSFVEKLVCWLEFFSV